VKPKLEGGLAELNPGADKAAAGVRRVVEGGMVVMAVGVKRGDLLGGESRAGVRALIVAKKPGNSGGAKGGREVDS
jgi:hypothetical protein